MKRFLMALGLAAASLHAAAAPNVGVSVHVGQPGAYGRIDIGNVPQPPVVIYPQPVIIQQPSVSYERRPIYLHVPPGHSRNWRVHCHRYNACGQPVYFVRDDWYRNQYRPHAMPPRPRPGPPPRHEVRRDDHRHDHRHDHRGDRHDHKPGKGKGHDRGHDNGPRGGDRHGR